MGPTGPAGATGPQGPAGLGFRSTTAFQALTVAMGDNPSPVASLTTYFPANGFAMVVATGYCFGEPGQPALDVRLGLENANDALSFYNGGSAVLHLSSPTVGTATGRGFDSFSASRVFAVNAGDNPTYYLNAVLGGGAAGAQKFTCKSALSVFFAEAQLPATP